VAGALEAPPEEQQQQEQQEQQEEELADEDPTTEGEDQDQDQQDDEHRFPFGSVTCARTYRTFTLNRKMPPVPGFTGSLISQRSTSEPTSFCSVTKSAFTLLWRHRVPFLLGPHHCACKTHGQALVICWPYRDPKRMHFSTSRSPFG